MRILAELMSSVRPLWDEPDPVKDPPAPDPSPSPEPVGDPPAEGDPAPEPEAKPDPAPGPDWRDKRIATLTAKLAEARQNKAAPAEPSKPLDPTTDFNARVAAAATETAERLVAVQKFNDACNTAAEAGRVAFGKDEFDSSVKAILNLVDSDDPASQSAYADMLESAIETGEAPALLYELGRDLNEAQRILALPSKRRAIELTKMAAAVAVGGEPSKLPKPITTIESRGSRHEAIAPSDPSRSDNLSTADWMARRNAEIAATQARRA